MTLLNRAHPQANSTGQCRVDTGQGRPYTIRTLGQQAELMLSIEQRAQALHWLAHHGYDLGTISQHFGVTRDELACELNTVDTRCERSYTVDT